MEIFFGPFGGVEEYLAMEEVDAAVEDDGGVTLAVVERSRACADVGWFAAEDFFGVVERSAALPELDDEGVAGLGHGAGTPVAGDEEGVFVDPGDVLFGVREDEAVLDELAGAEVELAEGVGVFAAGGEGDEAEAVSGVEAVEAFLDPLLVVLFGEGVVVDDGVPVGVFGEVAFEGGAAEDAADVLGVLPGVVDFADAELGAGQAGGGFEDLEGCVGEGGVDGSDVEGFGGAGVFGVDPGHGALAVDVFEPLVFVGGVDVLRSGWGESGGGKQNDESSGAAASKMHSLSSSFLTLSLDVLPVTECWRLPV